jgi:hypothetical protein
MKLLGTGFGDVDPPLSLKDAQNLLHKEKA